MKRETQIETLRGIAIILMVLGHVVGTDSSNGLKVREDSWYYYIFYIFKYVRMPLFTVISGYVYAIKPLSASYSSSDFVLRKIQRLIIPFVVAATLLFIIQVVTPGTNSSRSWDDLPWIYTHSFAHFWFVQGMFFVFLIILVLERALVLNSARKWFYIFSFVTILFLFGDLNLRFLSIYKWPFLLMFFLWGVALKRFDSFKALNFMWFKGVNAVIFFASFGFQQYLFFTNNLNIIDNRLDLMLTVLIGLSSSFLLINIYLNNRKLILLGNYSYEIYLYHVFGSAGARIILYKIGITAPLPNLVFGLLLGLFFPIVMRLVVNKSNFFRRIFFGDKTKKTIEA